MPEQTLSLLQRRGIEAEVLIPLIRRLEQELGRERAHLLARETIEKIAREQGAAVAGAVGRDDLVGFREVRDSWGGAGGDLTIETLRDDGDALHFNVTGCRFAEMYRQLGASDLGFLLSCARDFTLSTGYSERLRLERTQTIMQGASHCDFRYRLEGRETVAHGEDDAPGERGAQG
ncbi:MAG: L-2-amino-thiazoline-4-carboxylic acid hydrolase [Chloroflexi bacterium]|nr:L-2-amino-thiazoline-4-carboxylic acid hydrolase [Chloroflexota bacterium]